MSMNNDNYETQQSNMTIDLREYAHLLWHWAWLILVAGVIAGGIAYFINSQRVPLYTASTQLLVSEPPKAATTDTSQSAIVPSNLMAQTYTQMMTNLPVLQQVVERLNIPLDPEILKTMISVALIPNTQLIQATVTDTNPQRAAAIANTLGSVFAEQIQSLQSVRFEQSRASLTQQISEMETQIQLVSDQLAMETDPLKLNQLDTKLTQYKLIYSNLVTSFEQLRISEAQSTTIVAQVEPAVIPSQPVNKNIIQSTMLAAFVAMLLTAGVISATNLLDNTVRNPDEISRQLDLPVLGVIPHHTVKEAEPITQLQPYDSVSEAYRSIYNNLDHKSLEHKLHRILICSPLPEDGKTTVATNLAIIIAERGIQTILVDGNMRWPRTHLALGLPNQSGLSNFIPRSSGDQIKNLQATRSKNLSLVSSGPLLANPADFLGSKRMTTILDWLSQRSDIILIDTAPALIVTDAAILASQVDGIVIVVKAGKTKMESVKRMVTSLRQQGSNLLGVVINDVRFKNPRYSYYYRDYFTISTRIPKR